MRKLRWIVIGWYFLATYQGTGMASTYFPLQAGPFPTQEVCEFYAKWADKHGADDVSPCWEVKQ